MPYSPYSMVVCERILRNKDYIPQNVDILLGICSRGMCLVAVTRGWAGWLVHYFAKGGVIIFGPIQSNVPAKKSPQRFFLISSYTQST